jgi:NitT/TauT family transport system substrate-binding protein
VRAQRTAPVPLKVRTSPYLGYAILKVAQDEGFFAQQGLQVEFTDMSSDATVPSLIRGDIDVLPGVLTPAALNAIARGARIRVVASHGEYTAGGCTQSAILVKQSLIDSGKLTSRDGLKSLTIAGTRSPSTSFVLDKWLQPYGLSTEDLTRVDLPEAIEGEALRTGRIDISTMGEPSLTQALAAGDGVVWKALNDVAPGFQYGTVLFGPGLLDRRPEIGERFMMAYAQANRVWGQGKTPRNIDIVADATGLGRDLVSRLCWPVSHADAAVKVGPLLEFEKWALSKGLIDRAMPISEIVDTRFTDAVRRMSAGPR